MLCIPNRRCGNGRYSEKQFNSQNVKIDTASRAVTAHSNFETNLKMRMRIPHICLEISYTLKVDQDCLFFLYAQTNPGILLYLLMKVQRTQKKLLQQGKGQLRVIVIGFLYIVRM